MTSSTTDKEHVLQWVNELYKKDIQSTCEPMIGKSDSFHSDVSLRYSTVTSLLAKRKGHSYKSNSDDESLMSQYNFDSSLDSEQDYKTTKNAYNTKHDRLLIDDEDFDCVSNHTEELLDNSIYYPVNMAGELSAIFDSRNDSVMEILRKPYSVNMTGEASAIFHSDNDFAMKILRNNPHFIAPKSPIISSKNTPLKSASISKKSNSSKHLYSSHTFNEKSHTPNVYNEPIHSHTTRLYNASPHISVSHNDSKHEHTLYNYSGLEQSNIANAYNEKVNNSQKVNKNEMQSQTKHFNDDGFHNYKNYPKFSKENLFYDTDSISQYQTTKRFVGDKSVSETSTLSSGSLYDDPVTELLSSNSFKYNSNHPQRSITYLNESINMQKNALEYISPKALSNERVKKKTDYKNSTLLSPEYRKLKDFFSSSKGNRDSKTTEQGEVPFKSKASRVSSKYISERQSFQNHTQNNLFNRQNNYDNYIGVRMYNRTFPLSNQMKYTDPNHTASDDDIMDEEMIEIDKMLKELQIETSGYEENVSKIHKIKRFSFDVKRNYNEEEFDIPFYESRVIQQQSKIPIPIPTRVYKNTSKNIRVKSTVDAESVQTISPSRIPISTRYMKDPHFSMSKAKTIHTNQRNEVTESEEYNSDSEEKTDHPTEFHGNVSNNTESDTVDDDRSLESESLSYISSEIKTIRTLLQFLQNQDESNEETNYVLTDQDTMLNSDLQSEKSFSSVSTDQTLLDAKKLLMERFTRNKHVEKYKNIKMYENETLDNAYANVLPEFRSNKNIDNDLLSSFGDVSGFNYGEFESSKESDISLPKKKKGRTELYSSGSKNRQLETLKQMLFNLQKINKDSHSESELLDTFLKEALIKKTTLDEPPVIVLEKEIHSQDKTLQRACVHLSNLKTILNERKMIINRSGNEDETN